MRIKQQQILLRMCYTVTYWSGVHLTGWKLKLFHFDLNFLIHCRVVPFVVYHKITCCLTFFYKTLLTIATHNHSSIWFNRLSKIITFSTFHYIIISLSLSLSSASMNYKCTLLRTDTLKYKHFVHTYKSCGPQKCGNLGWKLAKTFEFGVFIESITIWIDYRYNLDHRVLVESLSITNDLAQY